MRRTLLILALALIGTAVSVPSAALAQRGPSVCFYEHVNFQGRAYCIRVGQRVDFVGQRVNDQFSSVRIPRGATVRVCEHANFRGRCRTLHRSESSFVPLGFNDMVSAVAAERSGRRNDRGPRDRGWDDRGGRHRDGRDRGRRGRGEVCFFEHDNYRGRRFCAPVGRPVGWVGNTDNDKFSSLRMPRGVTVTVCRDRDFRGPCRSYRGEVHLFGGGWNDTISSFRSH